MSPSPVNNTLSKAASHFFQAPPFESKFKTFLTVTNCAMHLFFSANDDVSCDLNDFTSATRSR